MEQSERKLLHVQVKARPGEQVWCAVAVYAGARAVVLKMHVFEATVERVDVAFTDADTCADGFCRAGIEKYTVSGQYRRLMTSMMLHPTKKAALADAKRRMATSHTEFYPRITHGCPYAP